MPREFSRDDLCSPGDDSTRQAPAVASRRPTGEAPSSAHAWRGSSAAAGALTPAAVLGLQRTAGNRATARMLERRGLDAPGRRLQRLIAVNPAGTPAQDYAIIKQVHQLRASQNPPHAVVMLTHGVNFRVMAAGEDLFIVSHGDSQTGNLRNISTQDLIAWLNDKHKGVPANFGRIMVLSCYGGVAKPDTALAERIAAGLKEKGHVVEGATGFSFGTAEFSATGHSSVLSEDLRVFYSADDVDAMAQTWADMFPSHDAGVLAPLVPYVNQFKTIKQNLQGAAGAKGVDDRIKGLITHFKTRAKAIEQGLGAALALTAGATIGEKITSLEAPAPPGGALPAHVTSWNALLAEQYQLFTDYYLWTDPATAFNSFTS